MSNTAVVPSSAHQELYGKIADVRSAELLELNHQALAVTLPFESAASVVSAETSGNYGCEAQIAIASAAIRSWIYTNPCLNFDNGRTLRFEAETWGLAVGAGVVWMKGSTYLPPDELLGEVTFQFAGGPICELTWWKNGRIAGFLLGGGLAVHGGHFGGTGRFTS